MKEATRDELRKALLFAAAVASLVFVALAYRPALEAPFVWDDHVLLDGAASYRRAPLLDLLTEPFWPEGSLTDARPRYYRPLVLLSYRFDLALGGAPDQFHFTNVLLHLATCTLFAVCARRLGASWEAAVLAAPTWGVMPRLTEAVAWVSGRADVLACCFGLGALAVWPAARSDAEPRRTLIGTWVRAVLAGALVFASCLSKEVGLAFALVVAILAGRRDARRAGLCLGLPVLGYAALRTIALAGPSSASRDLGAGTRLGTVFEAVARYAEMILDPFRSRTSIGLVGEVDTVRAAVGGTLAALALVIAAVFVRRAHAKGSTSRQGMQVGLVLAATSLGPVLHVVPLALAGSVAADRLLYVPLAGIMLAIACAPLPRPRVFAAAALAGTLLLGATTTARANDYTEELRFWIVAAEQAHPHNTMPRMALAGVLLGRREPELACRLYDRSLETLAQSRAAPSAERRARENRAVCAVRLGRYEEALALTEALARSHPESARIQLAVAFAHLHLRAFDAAASSFARAAALDPALTARIGVPAERLRRIQAADRFFEDLEARKNEPVRYAKHLADLGRLPEACDAFLAVATNRRAAPDARYDATAFLLLHGSLEAAELATAAFPPGPDWDDDLRPVLPRRRAHRRALEAVLPRVEALAR
ncbi:MAG: hypothetical protein KIT84_23570 [Labilithrix sp.]|nr:hypothetical protein [Labilithrix sp.]MCW5814028.1 hypothetical protein [Labilithrix sp.]